jgi:shikimate dehydrogenase
VRAADGRLVGHSTDGDGFVASLRAAGVDVDGAVVAVVGAGAAARSVVDALGRTGVASITIVNRSAERAAQAVTLARSARVGSAAEIATAGIVVNATSVGLGATGVDASDVPFDPDLLRAGQVVADLVYHPLETPLLRRAAAAGCTVVDGLGMLIHQAVLQQELWTGRRPDVAVMRAAALDELSRRRTDDRT